jgi:hypothetical protein
MPSFRPIRHAARARVPHPADGTRRVGRWATSSCPDGILRPRRESLYVIAEPVSVSKKYTLLGSTAMAISWPKPFATTSSTRAMMVVR